MSESCPPPLHSRAHLWIILVFSLLAFAASWWVANAVFLRSPITTDEHSYLFQAHLFAQGKLKYEAPAFIQPFRYPMIILDPVAGWFSRYPPGHALWLTLGIWSGSVYGIVALAAAAGMALTLTAVRAVGGSSIAAGCALLLSPFFLFTFGTLMSHTTGFMAAAGMILGYVLWQKTGRNLWAVFAGLAWAWLVMNRTYTALLIAVPFAIDALWHLWLHRTDRRCWWGTVLFAGSACSGIFALLVYNALTLGDPLQMTYLYYDPSDQLGFGWRHNHPVFPAPEPVLHSLGQGLDDLAHNLHLLDDWLFGFNGSLIIWLLLTLVGWTRRWSLLLSASALSVAAGYVLFWYPGWNETGPNYYIEALPAMILTASLGVATLFRWSSNAPRLRALAIVLALLVWGGFTLRFSMRQGSEQQRELKPRAAFHEAIQEMPPQSLLFIKPEIIAHAWPNHDLVFNPKGAQQPVVLARWLEDSYETLIRQYSAHTPYVLTLKNNQLAFVPAPEPTPMDHTVQMRFHHRKTGGNLDHPDKPHDVVRYAESAEHSEGFLLFGRQIALYPGTFRIRFDLETRAPSESTDIITLEFIRPLGEIQQVSHTFKGTLPRQEIEIEFTLDDFQELEPRVYYHGAGSAYIYSIHVEELPQAPQ
ncbi:MAG: hypothetical protein PF795_01250 [Kiritimatiellae bacterium]|jgi:hypothetical protein|nr:hypothetical protein [Kiritimatiellia bacterium]